MNPSPLSVRGRVSTSLVAREERAAKRDRPGDPLTMLDQHIDFVALARAVDAKLVIGDTGPGGRPPYPTEALTAATS